MADTISTTDPLAAGVTTSEYKATKLATIVSIVAAAVGLATSFLTSLQEAVPGLKWVSLALTALGMIGTILATLGYQQVRGAVKVAALNVSSVAPTVTANQAAANLGQVP